MHGQLRPCPFYVYLKGQQCFSSPSILSFILSHRASSGLFWDRPRPYHPGLYTARPVLRRSLLPVAVLTTLGKAAEVTGHAAFLKTDGLAAFRAGLSQEAVFILAAAVTGPFVKISPGKDPGNGIGYGEDQAVLLKDRVFSADTL